MMKKIFFLVITFCAFSALANINKSFYKKYGSLSRVDAVSFVQSVEKTNEEPLTIKGSSDLDYKYDQNKKAYYLYGAEHLELKNYYFDIPVVYNDAVKKWIKFFQSKGKNYFLRYSERSGRYAPVLGRILEDYGLPRDLIFLAMAESGFHNNAKSWAKAVGPWQFMPFTGKRYGLKINWYLDERRDPIKATIAAARYLKTLYKRFGSWELAAAGYNAGEGKVSRAIKRYSTESFWKIRRGRYLKSETKNYVPKIMALAIIGKNLESFGFTEVNFHDPLDFDEIDLAAMSDLYKVSEKIDLSIDEIRKYNPEIMRWMTPPDVDNYKLRVPIGYKAKWEQCCANNTAEFVAKDFQNYHVKHQASIPILAKKFKIKADVLAKLNGVSTKQRFTKGDDVRLPFRVGQSRRAPMYSDLYELPSKRVRAKRSYKRAIRTAIRKGRKIKNPTIYYTVKRGDTLWHVSKKTGVSLNTLIKTNLRILGSRQIRAGDRLAIR